MFIADAPSGRSVITLTANDPDNNAQLRYSFVDPISAVDPQRNPVNPNSYNFRVCICLSLLHAIKFVLYLA